MAVAWVKTSGDPGRAARALEYFAGQQFIDDASDEIAAAGLKKIQDGFNAQQDPYGNSWAPIRRRGKILQKSGRLYRSAVGQRRPGGVELGLTADYAAFQNDGTRPSARAARHQPINRAGKFISRERAGRYVRKVGVRHLPGHINTGITARPMIPDDRGLPPTWGEAFDRSVDLLVSRKERSL